MCYIRVQNRQRFIFYISYACGGIHHERCEMRASIFHSNSLSSHSLIWFISVHVYDFKASPTICWERRVYVQRRWSGEWRRQSINTAKHFSSVMIESERRSGLMDYWSQIAHSQHLVFAQTNGATFFSLLRSLYAFALHMDWIGRTTCGTYSSKSICNISHIFSFFFTDSIRRSIVIVGRESFNARFIYSVF